MGLKELLLAKSDFVGGLVGFMAKHALGLFDQSTKYLLEQLLLPPLVFRRHEDSNGTRETTWLHLACSCDIVFCYCSDCRPNTCAQNIANTQGQSPHCRVVFAAVIVCVPLRFCALHIHVVIGALPRQGQISRRQNERVGVSFVVSHDMAYIYETEVRLLNHK